jgi:hypothetical protein
MCTRLKGKRSSRRSRTTSFSPVRAASMRSGCMLLIVPLPLQSDRCCVVVAQRAWAIKGCAAPVAHPLRGARLSPVLEQGTYRLVWTQGITRTRWVTLKLARSWPRCGGPSGTGDRGAVRQSRARASTGPHAQRTAPMQCRKRMQAWPRAQIDGTFCGDRPVCVPFPDAQPPLEKASCVAMIFEEASRCVAALRAQDSTLWTSIR